MTCWAGTPPANLSYVASVVGYFHFETGGDRGILSLCQRAAGVTDRLWSVEDLVALWEQYERRAERAA